MRILIHSKPQRAYAAIFFRVVEPQQCAGGNGKLPGRKRSFRCKAPFVKVFVDAARATPKNTVGERAAAIAPARFGTHHTTWAISPERTAFLDRRLTLLLPVRNAQASLSDHVSRILETVADWTTRFELVIVDRGSTDATAEVADELARRYPQVRAVMRSLDPDAAAELRSDLPDAPESCFVIDGADAAGSLASLARTWRGQTVALSRIAQTAPSGERPSSGDSQRSQSPAGLLRRAANDQRAVDPGRKTGPARPNFLARLKDFALGE